MIRKYIIEADDSIKGFNEEIARLEREWGAEEIEPCEDTISRDAVEKITWEEPSYDDALNVLTEVRDKVRALPSVTPQQTSWIPIKTRPLTEEEKEEIGHEYAFMYDCPLPDDGQEVLITDCYGNVEIDTFCRDHEGFYFENNCDDGEVIAWQPKPEGYKAESEDKE
jgi:hypothetical protein